MNTEHLLTLSDTEYRRRSKIVATVGPASRDPKVLAKLMAAGVNVFRLNFSHGSHEEHSETVTRIRSTALENGYVVAILQDLSGPKIRISNVDGPYLTLENGAELIVRHGKDKACTSQVLYVESLDPAQVLQLSLIHISEPTRR